MRKRAAANGRTDRKALEISAFDDDHEEETSVPVTVRAVVAEATRGRRRPVRVQLEDPINRDGLKPREMYFSINLDTGRKYDPCEISTFMSPETILALETCLGDVIARARARGLLPSAGA
jgi:hypothetical protein